LEIAGEESGQHSRSRSPARDDGVNEFGMAKGNAVGMHAIFRAIGMLDDTGLFNSQSASASRMT
jgi:hypothetical protein